LNDFWNDLFFKLKLGRKGPDSVCSSKQGQAVVISRDALKKIREECDLGKRPDAVIISQSELDRIKHSTTIKSKEMLREQRKLQEETKEQLKAKNEVIYLNV